MCWAPMNRAQRVVLIAYCLLLIYCCLWIPWHRHVSAASPRWYAGNSIRLGYGWLWIGPRGVGEEGVYADPDLYVIALRIGAATAVSASAFLLSGMKRKSEP